MMIAAAYLLIDSPAELSLLRPQFTLGAIAFFLMGISAATVTRWGGSLVYLWIQLILDTVFVSLLVATDTTPQSPFFVLYTINILGAVRLLSFQGVMVIAIVDCSAYMVVSVLGVLGMLQWEDLPPLLVYWNIISRIFGLLLVGVLSVSLARQQTFTERLLSQEVRKRVNIVKIHEDLLNQLPVGLLGNVNKTWVPQNEYAESWANRLVGFIEIFEKHYDKSHFELGFPVDDVQTVLFEFNRLELQNGGSVFLFQDVTQLRAIERQAMIDDRLAAGGRLAASLAHEIRNPLGALSGSVQILATQKESRLHNIILREVKRIDDLVHNFLQSSKPPELKRTFQNIHDVLYEIIEFMKSEPRFAELSYEIHLASENSELYIDRDQIYQVFINLVLNAAHATPSGGRIEIGERIEAREWVAWVKDTGMGISSDHINKIFDPFFTLRTGGTGLGLANVEQIIRAHRGRVWVESREGEGSQFYCSIPLQKVEYG